MSEVTVAGINIYPIKSCAPIEAQEVTFNEFGIEHDREWMLVGASYGMLSQRQHPKLAQVQTRFEDSRLLVQAPNMEEIAIPIADDPHAADQGIPVTVWEKPGLGTPVHPEIDEYFSDYLQKDTRLLRMQQPRQIKPECRVPGASSRTAFADGFPTLLTSNESLAELNKHLVEPVPMNRFRPNIIVEGAPAYDEDYWRELQIGGLRSFVVRACVRCVIPDIDQQLGRKRRERVVTKALLATRRGLDPIGGSKGVFFGQNLTHVPEPGVKVRVGDPVTILSRRSAPNWQALS